MLSTLLGEKYFPLDLYSTQNVGTIFADTLKPPKLWTKSMGSYGFSAYGYNHPNKINSFQVPTRAYSNYFKTTSYYLDSVNVEAKDPPKKYFLGQVIALKRIHEVDRRCDRYSLLLSDGHAKEGTSELNTEEVFLAPDLNWLIEERMLKIYDVIRVTDYASLPIPGNLRSVILFEMEVLQHNGKPIKLNTATVIPSVQMYINVEKSNMTNVKAPESNTLVRIASTYEQWLEGGGDIKGNENAKILSTIVKPKKRKHEFPFFTSEKQAMKAVNEDYADSMLRIHQLFDLDPDVDQELEDVTKYQKQMDNYYASLYENKAVDIFDHIHTPHCCDNNGERIEDLSFSSLSEVKSEQPSVYNLQITLVKKFPLVWTSVGVPLLPMIATDMDGVMIEMQGWGKRAAFLMFNLVEGYTYSIEAAYAVQNRIEAYKRTDHPYVVRIGCTSTVLLVKSAKAESTLVTKCIDSVTTYFMQNRFKRKSLDKLKSREGLVFSTEGRLPIYLDIKGRTSLEVLTQLPNDIWEKVLEKLDFRSLHEIYYSKRFPFITSTHFSIAIKRDELQYYHLLLNHSQHLIDSGDNYGILHGVYDNLAPFYCTSRDKDERELPKLFTNFQSEDYAKHSEIFPIAPTFDEFRHRFEKFTHGLLDGINWDNVFCAGGSILGPLLCETQVNIENCHTDPFWKDSDIDLFIWGLDPVLVEEKIRHLYEVITRNLYLQKQKFLVCHSKRVITIVTEPPYRNIQLICHYHISPVDVLCSFDLDCCCVGYDGKKVWASPRAIRAITKKYNLMDWCFAPASAYSYRLYKYSKRGFCIAAPGLDSRYERYSYENHMYEEIHDYATRCFSASHENWDSIIPPVSAYTVTLPKIALNQLISTMANKGSDSPYHFVGTINDIDFDNFATNSRSGGSRAAKFATLHFTEQDIFLTNHHPLSEKPYFDMHCNLIKMI